MQVYDYSDKRDEKIPDLATRHSIDTNKVVLLLTTYSKKKQDYGTSALMLMTTGSSNHILLSCDTIEDGLKKCETCKVSHVIFTSNTINIQKETEFMNEKWEGIRLVLEIGSYRLYSVSGSKN